VIKTLTRECYPIAREESSIRILGRDSGIFSNCAPCGIVSPDLLAACTTDATGWTWCYRIFQQHPHLPNHQPQPEHRSARRRRWRGLASLHLAKRPLAEMSSGEAKRTLIARALVHEPQTPAV